MTSRKVVTRSAVFMAGLLRSQRAWRRQLCLLGMNAGDAGLRQGREPTAALDLPSSRRTPVTLTAPAPTTAPTSVAAPQRRPSTARLALMLGAFVALGPLTIDMYLPALPTIREELGTTSATVQLTLTGTLIGLALGQLVIGPLSDSVGRRLPLLVGAVLHVVASVLCAVAPTMAMLGGLRVLQGIGAAGGAVVAMAIVR